VATTAVAGELARSAAGTDVTDRPTDVRILIEPSDYVLRNAGDMAMLHVVVTRLSSLCPTASIQVLSDAPELLPQYAPNSRPLASTGRRGWLADGMLRGPLWERLSARNPGTIPRLERTLRVRLPALARALRQRRGLFTQEMQVFLSAVMTADLVVVAGMGGITDAFPEYAHGVLETLSLAQHYGVPTVMVGQGLGPIVDRDLWKRAAAVLPRLNFISLREGYAGVPLLRRLRVPADRIMVTGDDAIELAYRARSQQSGRGLGINLRAAGYSGIDMELVRRLGEVVRESAAVHHAALVPVPISSVPGEEDLSTIAAITADYPDVMPAAAPASWVDVFEQIRCCRVLVTGSYHAGVFALAQGIPSVCVARSQYYVDKFVGLADQFGEGCQVIQLGESGTAPGFVDSVGHLWDNADVLRPVLLAKASAQIALGHTAYDRIRALLDTRR
jgi:polysaccharide pyruvyl transferase WcaK-like protein